ncbi:hypothetical protein Bbelb_321220 [Branchiostoma belcheri]|nr:hypothetical protein Bbelb_321220 [Branchiostoma belcheri]
MASDAEPSGIKLMSAKRVLRRLEDITMREEFGNNGSCSSVLHRGPTQAVPGASQTDLKKTDCHLYALLSGSVAAANLPDPGQLQVKQVVVHDLQYSTDGESNDIEDVLTR